LKILEGLNFLVVEDDEMLRHLLREIFEENGARVTEAKNGVIAFSLVQTNRFDVVLSDVRMPDGDGLTLAKRISELVGDKPAVFICSGFNDLTAESAQQLNILKVFEKPFEQKTMIDEIYRRLGR
jgi:CheY-like chemotaxis protein